MTGFCSHTIAAAINEGVFTEFVETLKAKPETLTATVSKNIDVRRVRKKTQNDPYVQSLGRSKISEIFKIFELYILCFEVLPK